MSQWKVERRYSKGYYLLGSAVPILLIFSLVTNELLLSALTAVLLLLLLSNHLYLQYIQKHVHILNEIYTKRFFSGEKTVISVPFQNTGKLPVFHAKWYFQLFDTDKSLHFEAEPASEHDTSIFERMLFLPPKTKRLYKIEVNAVKRGIAEVIPREIILYDIFSLNSIRLFYRGNYQAETIVYPTPMPIQGIQTVVQLEKGNQPQRASFYEDNMMTIGTRNYTSGDPFNRINWKASVRAQELQTKLYEKVTLSHWTLVLNLKHENHLISTIDHLDAVLNQVAFTCQFATKHQITFEIYINIKMPKTTYGLHLPPGSGKKHLMTAFEMLARIRKSTILIPMETILFPLLKKDKIPAFILHFGTFRKEEEDYYSMVNPNVTSIYRVHSDKDGAMVEPVRGKKYDKAAN